MLAIITHNYPSDEVPWAGLFVVDHMKKLQAERTDPIKVFHYPFGEYPMTKSIRNPLKWPKFFRYFRQTPLQMKAQIDAWAAEQGGGQPEILTHWWFPNGTSAAQKFDNVHVICHGTDLYQLRKFSFIARHYAPLAREIKSWQCVSNDLKSILLDLYPFLDESIITVKPMPIGDMFVNKDRLRDDRLIVSVGSLIPRKNFDRLITEVAKVKQAKLEIYGGGPEKAKLQELIDTLGVLDRIKLAGQVTREELAEVYNRASLFVLLSDDEGYGLVLEEARVCGCKTMAYQGDGMEDTGLDFAIPRDSDVAGHIREKLNLS